MISRARALFVVCLAGCAAPIPDLGEQSGAIVNGTLGGDDAVVVLRNLENGGLCTGTLIAERVVLTAKHCIQEAFDDGPANANNILIGVGDNARNTTETLRVQMIRTTPGIYTEDSRGSIGRDLIGVDVAVLLLETGVSRVEPIPIRRESHTSLGGELITAIGFGETPSGEVGVKYTTMGRVTGTDSNLIYVGPLTCQGDSGGPMITPEREVAGVVSFGAGSCGSGYGAYNAIFPFLDMIDEVLTEAGSCLNDGAERCDGYDNDCNELVDETCTPIGGTCGSDTQCVGLMCRSTVRGSICTTRCDPLHPDDLCPDGFYCAFATGCEGFCVPLGDSVGSLPIGSPCTDDVECASLHCNDPGDGMQRCLTPCRAEYGLCLADEACVAGAGQCGSCVDADIVVSSRGLGEECTVGTECRSGMCFADQGRSYCSHTCAADNECADGYHCRDGTCASGDRGEIGDPCVTNGDCANLTFCAIRGEQHWCSRLCTSEACPAGFDCVAAGGTMICAPSLGLVGDPCAGNNDCLSGLCAISAEGGACTRQCGPDAPCAAGFECQRAADGITAVCVAPMPEPTDGGGCSAEARGSSRGAPLALGLAALLALAVRRRRS
jgi:MYXO-CTERM domain-containing protein